MFDSATFATVRENFPTFQFQIMGAKSSSPRTVQLENDSPVTVIDVSEAVVDRLKGLHAKGLYGSQYYYNNLKLYL